MALLPDGVDPAAEDVTGETYGPLKALTEQAAESLLPGAVMIVRPGLIVGPHDPTDRFTYWIRRMADGGEVLAPESPDVARTQVVDVADMARWIVGAAAAGRTGTYNAVAPPVPLADVLAVRPVRPTSPGFRGRCSKPKGSQPWTDLPAWLPAPMALLLLADGSKAAAAGLESRPIVTVVGDLAAGTGPVPGNRCGPG